MIGQGYVGSDRICMCGSMQVSESSGDKEAGKERKKRREGKIGWRESRDDGKSRRDCVSGS